MRTWIAAIAVTVASAALAGPAAAASHGKEIYSKSCAACHTAIPPKLGDKAAWAPRIKAGTDAMVAAVIKGKGAMPARGGASSLSDADIKAAVEYMVAQSK